DLGLSPLFAMLIGLVCALATMAGDLWESILKRRFGVKDAGNLIPGHGGLLDRVDGMMFAVVALAAARLAVEHWGVRGRYAAASACWARPVRSASPPSTSWTGRSARAPPNSRSRRWWPAATSRGWRNRRWPGDRRRRSSPTRASSRNCVKDFRDPASRP